MSKNIVKFQEIYELLVFTLNNALYDKELVDENGYILNPNGDKLNIDNTNVVVLSESIKDIEANVLNPFLNERKISSQLNYYYKTLSTSILIKLIVIINEILQKAYHVKKHSELNNKKERDRYIKENDCNLDVSPKYNDLISIVGNNIDENTLKQFKTFQTNAQSRRIENICYYGYNIKEEESNFYITYMEEKDVFKGGISINTIKIIRELTLKILCEGNTSFLTEKASENTHSKRFDSIIKLYFKMSKRFNSIIKCLDNDEYNRLILDEDKIDNYIKNLDEYSKLAHSRMFVSHKNTATSSGPSFNDSSLSEEEKVIYDAMGNPINLKVENNVHSTVGPDRSYGGPQFPNVVSVSGSTGQFTSMMSGMYNDFNTPNTSPMSMFKQQPRMNMGYGNMRGMSILNRALMG